MSEKIVLRTLEYIDGNALSLGLYGCRGLLKEAIEINKKQESVIDAARKVVACHSGVTKNAPLCKTCIEDLYESIQHLDEVKGK